MWDMNTYLIGGSPKKGTLGLLDLFGHFYNEILIQERALRLILEVEYERLQEYSISCKSIGLLYYIPLLERNIVTIVKLENNIPNRTCPKNKATLIYIEVENGRSGRVQKSRIELFFFYLKWLN